MRFLSSFLYMFLVIICVASGVLAEDFCDSGLRGNDQSPMAYQMRGDRCEGIFKLEVNSTLLNLASIVERFEEFDSGRPEDLTLAWSRPPGLEAQGVHIRAIGLDPRSTYRMDTALPATAGTFRWPLEILDRVDLTREDLGVRAWIAHPQPPDKDFPEIYLPLRIWQEAPPKRQGTLEVTFVPQVKLKEAYVSVVVVDLKAKPLATPLVEKQPLAYGYYPAKTPVFFEIPGLQATGFYKVDLLAVDSNETPMSYRFLLYYEVPK